ncbi:MAG: GNAT family N-acetyltransferase [Aerococcaceae bacterium]|nr:GNAT family N-acetyltransferase [Aerococcaceae bacterium]
MIRETRVEDAQALLDFTRQVGGETGYLTFGAEGIGHSLEAQQSILEAVAASERNLFLVAEKDGNIIGAANLSVYSRERLRHRGEIGISVRQAYHQQGIGTALLTHLIDHARHIGLKIITLEVRSDNVAAIALYKKFGFKHYGTLERTFHIDGQYFDTDYMSLHL